MSALKWIGSIILALVVLLAFAIGSVVFSVIVMIIVVAAFIRYGMFGDSDNKKS